VSGIYLREKLTGVRPRIGGCDRIFPFVFPVGTPPSLIGRLMSAASCDYRVAGLTLLSAYDADVWKPTKLERQLQYLLSAINAVLSSNGLRWSRLVGGGVGRISSDLLARAARPDNVERTVNPGPRVSPFSSPPPITRIEPDIDAQQARTVVQKQAQGLLLTKTVTFADGLRFEVPSEIALAVHTRTDCAPI
jgi:hypothetical protein